jgi:hypothetical protein
MINNLYICTPKVKHPIQFADCSVWLRRFSLRRFWQSDAAWRFGVLKAHYTDFPRWRLLGSAPAAAYCRLKQNPTKRTMCGANIGACQ